MLDRNLNAVLLYDRSAGLTTLLAGAPDGLQGFTDGHVSLASRGARGALARGGPS